MSENTAAHILKAIKMIKAITRRAHPLSEMLTLVQYTLLLPAWE